MLEAIRGIKIKLFFIVVLLMKCDYYDFREYYSNGNMSIGFRNFHKFQPSSKIHNWEGVVNDSSVVSKQLPRESRGFYFHTDDEDVIIDLEFIIPFYHIPIKHTMDLTRTALRGLLNLQTRSLLWSGLIVIVGIIVKTVVSALKQHFIAPQFISRKSSRSDTFPKYVFLEPEENNLPGFNSFDGDFLSGIESILYHNNIDLQFSAKEFVCHQMLEAKTNWRLGKAMKWQKIITKLLRTPFVQKKLLGGTVIGSVMEKAAKHRSCK